MYCITYHIKIATQTKVSISKCPLFSYNSHSRQTFTVWLRKKVIQVVIFASQSELSCKNHELLLTE